MGKVTITRMDSEHPDYYAVVGKLALDGDVAKGTLAPLTTEPGKSWWVAIVDGAVVGFCAAVPHGGSCTLKSMFVFADHRRQGIASQLFEARWQWCQQLGAMNFKSVVTPELVSTFRKYGFEVKSQRGKFSVMEFAS